jgi:hypothetical protein
VEEAKRQRPESWTCTGGELTTAKPDAQGQDEVTTTVVAEDLTVTEVPADLAQSLAVEDAEGAAARADDYDSWCESGSVCARKISAAIAEVKGNGAYGNQDGVIGAFDFVVRQSFNGPYPRWRSLLIWDYGPTVIPNTFYNACRINQTGPDGFCGDPNPVYFGNISSSSWRSWWPSSTGYDQHGTRLRGSTNYHDDNYGSFHAAGYGLTFYASVIHTGRWNVCSSSTGCKYYQVPWQA